VLQGFNDLATLFPEVAKEAFEWDPSTVTAKSKQRKLWQCESKHTWLATVGDRTPPKNSGCPYCWGRVAIVVETDLATLFPAIAAQACGWDPSTVTAGSGKKLQWRCEIGHKYMATVGSRTPPVSSGCPVCAGKKVVAGFNDLATRFPKIAEEADGWDPKTVAPMSNKKLPWVCSEGHKWIAMVNNRTTLSSGCPECSESSYKESLPAWFYLLERPGEQQFGVTNNKVKRLYTHSRFGWSELEIAGPFPGDQVLALEKKLKRWLRKEAGLVPGTHENWFSASLEVRSLAELKARSGVETELF
jgi:hypothetical protein